MRCITLLQPWATLVAAGAKPYEFRSWPAPQRLVGQRIAIHASARPMKAMELRGLEARLQTREAWTTALVAAKALPLLSRARLVPDSIPLSSVLCTAVLGKPVKSWEIAPEFGGVINDSDRDQHCNWAWPLAEIEVLEPMVPARGAQGFWEMKL